MRTHLLCYHIKDKHFISASFLTQKPTKSLRKKNLQTEKCNVFDEIDGLFFEKSELGDYDEN